MATAEMKIEVPRVPNFVRAGGRDDIRIPVGDMTDEQLWALGAEWTEKLIANANRQRTQATDKGIGNDEGVPSTSSNQHGEARKMGA